MTMIIASVAALAAVMLAVAGRRYWRLRGTRLVTCPETSETVAVGLHVFRAMATSVSGHPTFRLSDCSRWPERRNCGQDCLTQIEAAPEECLVRTIASTWYSDKLCILCRRVIPDLGALRHRPALMGPDGLTFEWNEVLPETLPATLATHQPVCWNCHVAETFRREYPELVTDRPPRVR